MTRLDQKLARIAADPSGTKEFVICDAKDSDMGFGLAHGGPIRDNEGKEKGRDAEGKSNEHSEELAEEAKGGCQVTLIIIMKFGRSFPKYRSSALRV